MSLLVASRVYASINMFFVDDAPIKQISKYNDLTINSFMFAEKKSTSFLSL